MTTARISAALAAALVTAGAVAIGPAAAPARAYGPASCVPDDLRVRYGQGSALTFEYLPGQDERADGFTVTVTGIDRIRFHDALAADPVVRERLGGGSFTESGDLILVADRTDETLIRNFVTALGGTWDAAQFRYGNREFVRSTGTDTLPCAV
ncbi:hypothetical protein [Nocardia tengchongensis]|uniref:hypothetical protein n=1 Tax=Nocardia tengchongensis TaxID=2055889 RepID=UPI0036ACDB25